MPNLPALYNPPKADLWTGRSDSLSHERYFQLVHCINLAEKNLPAASTKGYALLGFACDLGVRRNLGRAGAAQGPDEIRRALSGLAVSNKALNLFDIGNISAGDDLDTAQSALAELVAELLTQKLMPIVLGGGHETAWGHYQGISKAFPNKKIGIINIDAHFDLRPMLADGQGSSGTPFLQIAKQCSQQSKAFSYFCLGIQPTGNTQSLFDTAKQYQVKYVLAETIMRNRATAYQNELTDFIEQNEVIYLTICLDAISAAFAPGVSAPQPLGLLPWQVQEMIKVIIQSEKVVSLDVVELAPNYDQDSITAKLAAQLLTTVLL